MIAMAETNDSGTFTLNLMPGIWYRVTASFEGLNHTISPVYLPPDSKGQDGYDIILTRTHRSAISGMAVLTSLWKSEGVNIQATAGNGSNGICSETVGTTISSRMYLLYGRICCMATDEPIGRQTRQPQISLCRST
jgi:hypothetical protein